MRNAAKDVIRGHEHGHLHDAIRGQEELLVDVEIAALLILLAAAAFATRGDLKRLQALYERYGTKGNVVPHCVHESGQCCYVNVSVTVEDLGNPAFRYLQAGRDFLSG
ncbi:hypothetical protein [Plantactinospora sp. DSM 117369]